MCKREGILKVELQTDKGVIRVKKQEMLRSVDKQVSVSNKYCRIRQVKHKKR